jgi:diguanylate cyclase (GGDEF)-like protein
MVFPKGPNTIYLQVTYFVLLVEVVFSTLCLLLISAQNRKIEGMRSMVAAFLLLLAANLMLVLNSRLPAFFPYVLGNIILLVAFVLLHFSFPEVRARARTQRRLSVALIVIDFAALMVATYIFHSHAMRVVLFSIVTSIQSGATAVILFRFADREVRYPTRCTAAIFALISAIQASRIVWVAIHRVAPDEVAGSSMRWIALLGYAVLAATIPLLYFWTMTVRLHSRLERLAFTDPLTGLLNRRSIEHEAAIELSRIPRTPDASPLSVILLDLDHFKLLNDRFGHPAGDHILQTLASAVAPSLRGFDRLARIGGEEFLVLLPQTTAAQALDIAERIRTLIANASFHFETHEIRATASLGVATTTPAPESWNTLMSRADTALYKAKAQGRNRVVG